jgi:polar amino acid transport system substrate-binding protein
MKRTGHIAVVVALTAALATAACSPSAAPGTPGATPTGTPATSAPAATPTATAAANGKCSDGLSPEASIAPNRPLGPPGQIDASAWPTIAAIKKSRSLKVGVASDILQLGARNPVTGAIEGFDIDMLHAIAKAIFNDPNKITFKVITAGTRISSLQGDVDIVARAFTMNCDRWSQIDFSSMYLLAGQKVLVSKKLSKGTLVPSYSGIQALNQDKKRVCATTGSTSIDRVKRDYPEVIPVGVPVTTDCLAKFQEGQVDAITGDDAILAGLAAQDPYAVVVGKAFSREPYGLGIAKEHPDLVQFVNAVLQQVRADGEWEKSYDHWLAGTLGPASPPAPLYGRAPQ